MVESQPGTVVAFNPSVSLSNFSASTRDHLIFNENQLVLAKVQQTQPTSAYAYSRSTGGITAFEEYKNTSGEFVYIDGSYYALSTGGVPTSDVHRIVVGFDQQVSTSDVIFWSTSFVDTDFIFMEYSFDNSTWFAVGAITWSYIFDDTIQINPADSPPTGEYKYSGSFDVGSITARYWRIRSDAEAEWLSGTSTVLTVDSTSYFPTTSSGVAVFRAGVFEAGSIFGYTGKTSTTFTGRDPVTYTTFAPEDKIVNIDDPFGNGVTEIQIIPTVDPLIQHWNSDGSQAVSVALEGSNYYHLTYDKTDDVYYALRFDHVLMGSSPSPGDNFNADTGVDFDTTLWVEDNTNVYFTHNTSSGTLDYKSSGGAGQLETTYGLDGNFNANIELVALVDLSSASGFFGIESKGYASGNEYIVSTVKGDAAYWAGAALKYTDTVAGAAELQNFRVCPEGFDFSAGGGEIIYSILYDVGSGAYNVSITGDETSYVDAVPGTVYILDSATSKMSFLIANLSPPAAGTGFTVTVNYSQSSIGGVTVSGLALEVVRTNTNSYARYREAGDALFSSLQTGNIPVDERQKIQLYASAESAAVDIGADNFTVTGTLYYDSPVFSVVSLNKDGEIEQVSGVSDSDGYVIKRFDIIDDVRAEYNDYITPVVSIATNAGVGAAGEIYIKVNDSLYKYLKSDLPLDLETGASASVSSTGEIPSTGITNFAYNGYSGGGLSYIEYIADLSGVFVKTINTTTLTAVTAKAMLDVASINYSFAWNVSDLSTLYFVDGTDLKLYDMNETKAAFVNVTSDKQVLAAGTAETATVTAQVLNVYGEPKSTKSMTFTVSAGDGALSPATGCSDVNGEDTSTYTVGSAVGTAALTVAVSDSVC